MNLKDLIQLNSIRWYHWLQKNFDPGWPRRAEPCWEPSSLASPAFALWMELSHLDGIANSNSTKLISMLSQCRPARFESSFISRMKYSAGRNMCPGQKGRLSDVCKMLSGAATRGIGLVHGNCQVKKLPRSFGVTPFKGKASVIVILLGFLWLWEQWGQGWLQWRCRSQECFQLLGQPGEG